MTSSTGERALRNGRSPATGLRRSLRAAASAVGVREWRRPLRRTSASWRPLPDFVVIGAQKSGTTTIYDYLLQHPNVRQAFMKEVHFFDHAWDRGPRWYRSHFAAVRPGRARTWLTGEATPYYLLHPLVPGRTVEMCPEVRLVAVLRHPVDRAYSGFQHSRALGLEPLPDFARALDLEEERTAAAWERLASGASPREPAVESFSYLRRSRYAEQLQRWYAVLPDPEQLLVVLADDLFDDPVSTMAGVMRHVGLVPPDDAAAWARYDFARRNARNYSALSPELRRRLGASLAEDLVRLEEMLGRRTGWREP